LFSIYSIITILLYLYCYVSIPDSNGFSFLLQGLGTDDHIYYSQATGFNVARRFVPEILPFSYILKIPSYLSLTYPPNILNLLFFNLIMLVFLPIFTSEFAYVIFKNIRIKHISFVLTAFCPFFISNGVVLMRDIWIPSLLMISLYLLSRNLYFFSFLPILLSTYIRLGSGVLAFLIFNLFTLYFLNREKKKNFKKTFLFILIFISAFFISNITVEYLSSNSIEFNSFIREEFYEKTLESGNSSVGLKIMNMPMLIRIPGLFIYFLLNPLPDFRDITEYYMNPRIILYFSFGFLNIFYIGWFLQGFIKIIKKNELLKNIFLISIIILVLGISNLSLQIRHKVIFMPFYYIVVAYGYLNKCKFGKIVSFFYIFIIVVYTLNSLH
jgi:hypothetical protein